MTGFPGTWFCKFEKAENSKNAGKTNMILEHYNTGHETQTVRTKKQKYLSCKRSGRLPNVILENVSVRWACI